MKKEDFIKPLGESLNAQQKSVPQSATAADKAGNFEKGHKRFKGIVKATNKEFDKSNKIAEEVANEDVLSALKAKLGDLLLQTLGKEVSDTDLKDKSDGKDDKEVRPVVKKITTDDGHEICIHGNEDDGFRISVKNKEAPSTFKTIDEAVMACEMYCAHRRKKNTNADYVEEA